MPPTEATILSNFLLPPAPLLSTISLPEFTDLFPRSQRSNPQVEYLYRELQARRDLDIERIKRNIAQEVKRGEKQRRQVVKARHRGVYNEIESIKVKARSRAAEVEVRHPNPGSMTVIKN